MSGIIFSPETLSRKTAAIFNDYCQHCSLHGFYYFYKSSNAWVHLVWSLIIFSGVVLCGYLGWMIFQKFVVDPTLTVVESIHHPMSEVPFPAVIICDPDVVYGPSTENITKMLSYRGYNASQISQFYRSFNDVKQKGFTPTPYLKKMHEMLEDLDFPLNTLLKVLKKPCEVMLIECVWRSKVHNCSEMFRQVFLMSGYCCQFDMNYFQQYADSATTFISGVQVTEALEVTVDGRTFEQGQSPAPGYLLLYVLDQQDTVTFLDNSVTITPASHFDVNVDVWTIDSSDYVKALSVRSRKCIMQSDATYGAGFYHGCMVVNIMRRVVETCRCIPYRYKASELHVEKLKPCPWERLVCIYENIDKVLGNMKTVIEESECYQRCDYIQYETEVKHVWEHRRVVDLNNGSSKIIVHFVDNTCMKYRREVLYTWDQVLANLGGIFGLCLGGSMISLIELSWYTIHMLFTVVQSCFNKKVSPSKQKQKEMVIKLMKDKNFVGKYKFTN